MILLSLVALFASFAGIPLPEHPRPDWERAEWLNLNGEWEFGFAKGAYDRKIVVPFGWGSPASGVKNEGDTGYYRRTLVVPKDWTSARIFLVVGAADWETELLVDGRSVGFHRGGYTPFEFELTDLVEKGRPFVAEFRCWDEPADAAERSWRLYGKQGYGNVRGIWQTVYLEGRGRAYFDSVRLAPSFRNSSVTADVRLDAPASSSLHTTLEVDGKTVDVPFAKGEVAKSVEIPLDNPHPWNLDDPYLYDVKLALIPDPRSPTPADTVRTYFGLRDIGVGRNPNGDPYVTLNGKPVYLQLCLDQSYCPEGYYTFPSDDYMRNEILTSKRLGLNGNRVHIKVEVPRKLYWTDRLGLLIMADVPNAWGAVSDEMFEEHGRCFRGMLKRDFNHPSVFSWVLYNETWGLFTVPSAQPKTPEQVPESAYRRVAADYRAAKAADPTRLVEDNSPCHRDHTVSDLNSWHGYFAGFIWESVVSNVCARTFPGSEWNCAKGYRQGDAPMLNSECGNVWGYKGSTGDIDWSWDYHLMMNAFRRHLKCAGWLSTQHHDVVNEWTGYVRADRTMKETGFGELFPGMTLADLHAPAFIALDQELCRVCRPGETLTVPVDISLVTDRHAGKRCRLAYALRYLDGEGRTVETASASVEPEDVVLRTWQCGHLAEIRVKMPENPACGTVNVTLFAGDEPIARNFQCFAVKGAVDSPEPSAFEWSDKAWTAMDGRKFCGAGTGFFEYTFAAPTSSVVFRAEVSTKRLNGKDCGELHKFKSDMDLMVGGGAHDRSKNPNSYPMTSAEKYSGEVRVLANGVLLKTVPLPDDPADSRGILSWLSQRRSAGRGEQSQTLDEAGSYGYLVETEVPADVIGRCRDGKLVIRLAAERTGLAVYGSESGRYPFGPHVSRGD